MTSREPPRVFRKVLIANRGEIARRVMRTCRRLGIETVAVYSDADADAPHVHDADHALRLGPAPASESYLDVARVIDAARRSAAEAIHPGYGFLSENPTLPEACERAGVVFVGPAARTIRLMGDKAAAKRHLEAAGVPVVPGAHDDDLDDDALAAAAGRIGFPVLVKAVAGGGGKGMRAVHDAAELGDAIAAARREALGAFGDGRLILERLVTRPRHVEVQVLADHHGKVLHLLERECSIQRRHQKVVEETPSPAVDPELRQRMGSAAVTAASSVDYRGAGTVEFLLADTGEFFFLEMNTRLQVEHPVTELVTGIDLVEWQLRVAADEHLALDQDGIVADGHALEVRVYAEDPAVDFLPQTGRVHRFVHPEGPGIRVDSGIDDGSEVSRFYDPMLAKLVVHGPDRDASIQRMSRLLDETAVLGVTNNVEFLAAVIDQPAFASGRLTTGFIDEHLAGWSPAPAPTDLLVAVAVALQADHEGSQPRADGGRHDPWRTLGPWRTGQVGGWRLRLDDRGASHEMVVTGRAGAYRVHHDGRESAARLLGPRLGRDRLDLEVDGHEVTAHVVVAGEDVWAHVRGTTRHLRVVPPTHHADPALAGGVAAFRSPMPGSVIRVGVEEGDRVPAGALLVVVEAMKMEHPVKAPAAGTIAKLLVRAGDAVDGDQVLLEFEPDEEGAS